MEVGSKEDMRPDGCTTRSSTMPLALDVEKHAWELQRGNAVLRYR